MIHLFSLALMPPLHSQARVRMIQYTPGINAAALPWEFVGAKSGKLLANYPASE